MNKFGTGIAALALAGCSTFVGGNLVTEGSPRGTLAISNQTSNPINTVTISRCSAMSHGLDQLDGEIAPGNGLRWQVDAGCWDVQVAYSRGGGSGYDFASFSNIQVRPNQNWLLTVNGGGAAGQRVVN